MPPRRKVLLRPRCNSSQRCQYRKRRVLRFAPFLYLAPQLAEPSNHDLGTVAFDLEIVERTEHAFVVDYVPLGMDATIYWGSLDFKFRNNTNYPIRIKASVSGGQVHIQLIGTDEKDYYVKMAYETVSGPDYGSTKYKVYPEGNSQGYSDGQTIQTAYNGRTVKSYRTKYSKATDAQISSSYEATSTYSKRDKIICVIGDPNAPTDSNGKPIETTTEATQPPTVAPTRSSN